jgi:hypothetical protein
MEPGEYPVVGSNGIIGYHKQYTTEPQNKSINPALRIPQKKRKQTFFLLFRNVSLEKRGALQY